MKSKTFVDSIGRTNAVDDRLSTACRYDWLDGFRFERLQCQVHRHPPGSAVIIRRMSPDVLEDLAKQGALVGSAAEDYARRANAHGILIDDSEIPF